MLEQSLQQLNSPDPNERRAAITALANLKDPLALRPLSAIYRTDPDPVIRELALKAGRYIRQHENSAAPAPSEPVIQPLGRASAPVGRATVPAARSSKPTAPGEPSARDKDLARGYLDTATTHQMNGDKIRAVENLGKALALNPTLAKESFVANLIVTLTGYSVDDALPLLTHPDRRAELIIRMGGKRKPEKVQDHGKGVERATWDNVLVDFGLYWLVVTLSLMAIFVLTLNAMEEMFDEAMMVAPNSATVDLDAFFAAGVVTLVFMAILYGIGTVIGLVIQGAAIHVAATYFLAGNGTLVYLYRRIVPLQTVATLAYALGFVVLALVGSAAEVGFLISLGSVMGSVALIYFMSEMVGEVYDFGAGSGCGAIFLGSFLLIVAYCGFNYALFMVLGLAAGGG
ncbi:MAG: HEAT repeat domain-containing protein [Chloroflexi bacterium]|nr:HEAT repeat domain-containing protein [Chloroflexota bacterium]